MYKRQVISNITETKVVKTTYNIEVADFNTYFAGNVPILVHNCNIPANKLNHLFSPSQLRKHNFEGLLASFGGNQQRAAQALIDAGQGYATSRGIKSGVFDSRKNPLTESVNGFKVDLGGAVINGKFNLGTAGLSK